MQGPFKVRSPQDLQRILHDEACVVIRGDALRVLGVLPSDFVGMTLTDPPYESLDRHRAKGSTRRLAMSKGSSNPWFETIPNTSFWRLYHDLYRIQRLDTICFTFCDDETEKVILTGRNPYNARLDEELYGAALLATSSPDRSKPPRPPAAAFDRAWPSLTWVKVKMEADGKPIEEAHDHIVPGLGYHGVRCDERIVYLEKGKRKLNPLSSRHPFKRLPSILCARRASRRIDRTQGLDAPWWRTRSEYPSQKPASIISMLIEAGSDPGDIILDPFAGSGITGDVALDLGRRTLLIDTLTVWMEERSSRVRDEGILIEIDEPRFY